jgi:hypothetical protein
MRALEQANRVRLARAELKRQVADGGMTVADVITECPWEAESMTIADLLMSQHRWGRTRCRRFLASIPMVETKRCCGAGRSPSWRRRRWRPGRSGWTSSGTR